MIFWILVGIVCCYSYFKIEEILNKDILETRRYYDYSSNAVEAYNKIANYFDVNRNKVKVVKMKYLNAYSPLNTAAQHCVIVRYKLIDKDFKVNF